MASLIRAPQWLKNMVGDTLANLFTFLNTMFIRTIFWMLTPILAPIYLIYHLISFVHNLFNDMMANAMNPDGMVTNLTGGSMLSMANAFFPIDDVAILLPILITLSIAAYTYRLIKSYIPTLS